MSSLGQIGSREAVDAILSTARSSDPTDRQAALSALGYVDDARAQQTIAELIKDKDESVAQAAIYASYNGGDEVDSALVAVAFDGARAEYLRTAAMYQLRERGVDLTPDQEKTMTDMIGEEPVYGGYGYGAGYYGEGFEGYEE
jgi:HEAT repeat protein